MIYFVRAKGINAIKIGTTKFAKLTRVTHQLQVVHPEKLVILHARHGCKKSETALHKRFAYARIRGEWFRPVPELLDHIDRMRGTKHPHRKSLLRRYLKRKGIEQTFKGNLMDLKKMGGWPPL